MQRKRGPSLATLDARIADLMRVLVVYEASRLGLGPAILIAVPDRASSLADALQESGAWPRPGKPLPSSATRFERDDHTRGQRRATADRIRAYVTELREHADVLRDEHGHIRSGRARADALSGERRSAIARSAAAARWGEKSVSAKT